MLGLDEIHVLAHAVEESWTRCADRGEFPPELIDPLLRAADSLRRHVEGAGEADGDSSMSSRQPRRSGQVPAHALLLLPSSPRSSDVARSASRRRSSTGCSTSSARPSSTAAGSSTRSASDAARSRVALRRARPRRAAPRRPAGNGNRDADAAARLDHGPVPARRSRHRGRRGEPRSSSSSPARDRARPRDPRGDHRADRPPPPQLGRTRHRDSGGARARGQARPADRAASRAARRMVAIVDRGRRQGICRRRYSARRRSPASRSSDLLTSAGVLDLQER